MIAPMAYLDLSPVRSKLYGWPLLKMASSTWAHLKHPLKGKPQKEPHCITWTRTKELSEKFHLTFKFASLSLAKESVRKFSGFERRNEAVEDEDELGSHEEEEEAKMEPQITSPKFRRLFLISAIFRRNIFILTPRNLSPFMVTMEAMEVWIWNHFYFIDFWVFLFSLWFK